MPPSTLTSPLKSSRHASRDAAAHVSGLRRRIVARLTLASRWWSRATLVMYAPGEYASISCATMVMDEGARVTSSVSRDTVSCTPDAQERSRERRRMRAATQHASSAAAAGSSHRWRRGLRMPLLVRAVSALVALLTDKIDR